MWDVGTSGKAVNFAIDILEKTTEGEYRGMSPDLFNDTAEHADVLRVLDVAISELEDGDE